MEGGATNQSNWSRACRKQRWIEKAGAAPDQNKITDYFRILTDIENLIKSNEKLLALLQTSMHEKESTTKCELLCTTLLKQIIINAEKNTGKCNTHRRHPEMIKKFSMALFIYAGPMAYEFIHQNMPEALPSLRTVQNIVHSHYKTLDEGQFRFDDLAQYLQQLGVPKIVSVGEDATRVIARIDYDNETDRCVGFVLPVDKKGVPVTDAFLATTFDAIEDMFAKNSISRYAYVYMAQPLCHNTPPFCLSCMGSDNQFTAQDVLLKWSYIISECKKRDIVVTSFGADGDPKLLKAMRVSMSLAIDTDEPLKQLVPTSLNLTTPRSWYSWFHCLPKPTCYVQDIVHVAVKLKARLLNPSAALAMGKYTATGKHLHLLKAALGKDQHCLREKDIDHKDRQNYDAVLHIVNACHLLDKIKDANATRCYVELIGSVISSYMDKSLDPLSRVEKAWYAVFFLRYWRQWILLHRHFTLKENFVTSNAYICVELNAHSLITFLITLRDHFPVNNECFVPWLLGSQCCERTFCSVRSMSSTYSTMINFGMLGLLRRLHRLHIQFSLECETNSGIVFPRVLKHQAKGGENPYNKCCLVDITNEKILAAVESARTDAKASIEKLGMADLLKKYSKWDCVPEASIDNDEGNDDDDEDDNDDNESSANKQDSEDVASSLIQEVCSEEPVQVTSDIHQIVARGLVESEVKDILENKQKLLSFKRMPSTTIPMYAAESVENSKAIGKGKKFCPFLEVKADNGSTIFIKKTTAVWLIQESEKVSSDRFYRVRRKQPYTSVQSTKFKKINAITITSKQCTDLVDDKSSSKESTSLNSILHIPDHGPEAKPTEVDNATLSNGLSSLLKNIPAEVEETIPINVDDVSDTLSDAWLRLNGITLYETDKYSLLKDDSWINGSHMTAVQLLLKSQFPHLKSLQDTLKQDIDKMQPAPTGSLQVLLVNCNHWVVASTCGTNNNTDITIYDSMYSFIHDHTKLLLSHLVHTTQKFFTVSVANVNKQAGGNDCGLFAAAYCTSIAYGQNPSSFVYDQAVMRKHLLKCLEAKHMTPFPTMRQRRIPQSKIVKVEVFCYCRSPNDKKEMVQCDKKGCKEWFHLQCIETPVIQGQRWYCNNCS